MKKLIFVLIGTIYFFYGLFAQTTNGKVTDERNCPIEFANVALYSLPDSTLINGTVTDSLGLFSLKAVTTANNFLKISFLGYQTVTVPAKIGERTIVLKTDSKLLNEVMVEGNLPRIELKNDALVTTVQNTVLSKVGTGNDVLKRLPSLTGDNGVFSVFGKGQAKIYINNREMRDVSELDNLNSADIKNVEIVNNPGARYDASVKAIIRVNTVHKVGDGFGFDVRSSYSQSQNVDLTEQFNVNYRRNGWDLFGTFKFNRNNWFQNSEMWQKTYVDTLWTQENTTQSSAIENVLTGIAGVNYEISPKHYLGTKYTFTAFPRSNKYGILNSTVLADGVFYDKWSSNEISKENNNPSHNINAYYNGTFGNLTADFNADYYTWGNHSNTVVIETSENYDERNINSKSSVDNRLFASRLILSLPLLGGKLSVGSEYANTHRTDDYQSEQTIVPSSNTIIKEGNIALFTEYSRTMPIGQISAGMRYENVNSEYFLNGKRMDEQSRQYSQWFPNVSFGTKIKNAGLQLSYTAKTKRPTYRQLSSNVFYGNRFLLQTGNPFLKPALTHDVTLVGKWRFVQLMISYKNELNAVIYWTEQSEDNPAISVLAYRNLDRLPSFTAFLTLSPTFGIWSPQLSAGFMKQRVTIVSNNRPVKLYKPLPIILLNNSFKLPCDFIATLDANYTGEGDVQNIHLVKNSMVVGIGINKSFFNDQLNVSLKGHDIFYENKDGNLLYNDQMELYQMNWNDSRKLELTVRFKFNTVRSKYKGTGAGQSEINRLK